MLLRVIALAWILVSDAIYYRNKLSELMCSYTINKSRSCLAKDKVERKQAFSSDSSGTKSLHFQWDQEQPFPDAEGQDFTKYSSKTNVTALIPSGCMLKYHSTGDRAYNKHFSTFFRFQLMKKCLSGSHSREKGYKWKTNRRRFLQTAEQMKACIGLAI